MLVKLFQNNLAKSTGNMTLFEHALGTALIAAFVLENFAPPGYPEEKKDLLLFSAFTHDLGKLDPQFQLMLQAAADGRPLPGKRVKHEASSLEYADLLVQAKEEIIALLAAATGRRIRGEIDPDLVMAFAVTHHGLFYLSREQTVTSNIGQNYPYTSESEAERRQAIERLVGARSDLAATLAERTTPLDDNERWWVWKCPTPGCPGRLHVAGYARDAHALVVVCDGTCGRIFQR